MRTRILWTGLLLLASCGGGGGSAVGLTIGDIQGTGPNSPLAGQDVSITGVVTGDFQDSDDDTRRNLGGFYVQGVSDTSAASSDGIFVFDGRNPAVDVNAGDRVAVSGTVKEHFGETQIEATSVRVVGTGSIAPVPVDLPADDLERYEGMLVAFPDTLTVTGLYGLGRFGEVTLSEGGRLYQFTNDNAPDVHGYNASEAQNARRKIVLDDGLRVQNPAQIHHLDAGDTPGYSIRLGDTVTGLVGNLRYSRGAGSDGDETWRLMPTTDPVFTSANPRPGAPAIGGTIRVAGFNVLNFFTTLDTGQAICGPRSADACRGADSAAEFTRQLDKTATALLQSGADILGLTELENNADASLVTLVDALNARVGDGAYAYIDTGIIHNDVIKAGLIYRTANVSPVGDFVLLDRSIDSRFNDDRNRPSLAQAFAVNATGARFSVIVNHLKSKGSSCDDDGDPNLGDGQGNCNLARTRAAAALADWIATDPTGSGDDDYLVIGDMNAYFLEDPIEVFRNAGLVDLLAGQAHPYSYVFDAKSGAYDYAFASPSLAPQVTGAIEWHINVDEAPLLDYNLDFNRNPALFDAGTPYRFSDHDPIVIGLDPLP